MILASFLPGTLTGGQDECSILPKAPGSGGRRPYPSLAAPDHHPRQTFLGVGPRQGPRLDPTAAESLRESCSHRYLLIEKCSDPPSSDSRSGCRHLPAKRPGAGPPRRDSARALRLSSGQASTGLRTGSSGGADPFSPGTESFGGRRPGEGAGRAGGLHRYPLEAP